MAIVSAQGGHRDPPICPACLTAMMLRPTAQFHYAAGFDEIIYDCEKCGTVSTIWSIGGSEHGAHDPREAHR
jgi:hypothetical protein